MKEDLKRKIENSKGKFQERLEYLIRDINMIEKDVVNIGQDLAALEQEFARVLQTLSLPSSEEGKSKEVTDSREKPFT
ncbi:MAG TPA: hypothetical protein ENL15_01290 [Firmicutes bacterium]|nr:hypothetical protein [Bacillota bacterium]